MATEITAESAADRARTRLIWSLHPAIRELVLAVNDLGAAIKAHDLRLVEETWERVQAREADYLEEVQR